MGRVHSAITSTVLLVILAPFNDICAQSDRGRDRRGSDAQRGTPATGRTARRGSLGLLRDATVQDELKLTDYQISQMEELRSGLRPNRESMQLFLDRLREAPDEEARQAIRAEIRQTFQQRSDESEQRLAEVLDERQQKRLGELSLQRMGPRALTQDEVAASLQLSEDQVGRIEALLDERDQASASLGFDALTEQRQAFRQQWDRKVLGILSAEQTRQWKNQLGTPFEFNIDSRGSEGPVDGRGPGRERRSSGTDDAERQATDSPVSRPQEPVVERPVDSSRIVASFDSHTSDNGAAAGKTSDEKNTSRTYSFNFRHAPWLMVLELFADWAGLTLDAAVVPPGSFNHYDNAAYTATEALDILNGYLLRQGHLLVSRDRFLVVVNVNEGVPPNLVPTVDVESLTERGDHELVNVVIPLDGIEAETAATEVDALMGPHGSVVALTGSNTLSVTDIAGNLRRIHALLMDSMAKSRPGDIIFRQFLLQHITAVDAEQLVRSQFGLIQAVRNVSAASTGERDDSRGRFGRGRFGRGGFGRGGFGRGGSTESAQTSGTVSASPTTNNLRVTADTRTNSLLISATAAHMALIESILEAIDVDPGGAGRPMPSTESHVRSLRVYQVRSADAQEVTKTVDAIMPGIVVNEDGRNGKIHIMATPVEHEDVARLIRQLDGSGGGVQSVAVIRLSVFDPLSVQATLRSLFLKDGEAAPTIEADLAGRQLLIRGSSEQIAQMKTLLAQLGEDGAGASTVQRRQTGPVRRIPLAGRDPREFLQLIRRFWPANGSNPIRVVVPSADGPVRENRTPAAGDADADSSLEPLRSEAVDKPSAVAGAERTNALREPTIVSTIDTESFGDVDELLDAVAQTQDRARGSRDESEADKQLLDELDAILDQLPPVRGDGQPRESGLNLDDTSPREQPSDAERRSAAPIVITHSGGNLIISSEDAAALDRMQDLIDSLDQNVPRRTTWTVFYLRSADTTEAAAILKEIFPASSVASPVSSAGRMPGGATSGLATYGGSLMDMTGVSSLGSGPRTLRIIPERRSNSLFITGPTWLVEEVEQILKILDATELPDSLRDRVPRTIDVLHADVEDVAEIVRDVYHDYLDPPVRNDRRNNPLAAALGGDGGRASGDDRAQLIRMTVAVDTSVGQLIVSASESLFRQVAALVESLDEAALRANKSVRIVSLSNSDAVAIRQSLISLIPKVRVSTTGDARRSSRVAGTSAPARSGSAPSTDQQNREAFRSFFEQRMRERFGGPRGAGQARPENGAADARARSRGGGPGGVRGRRNR